MSNLSQAALMAIISGLVLATPTFAKGLVTVEKANGDSENYPDVEIVSNNELLNLKGGNEGKVLEIVTINGPSNSAICALPTDSVPAGTYTVDPSTLTLIPQY